MGIFTLECIDRSFKTFHKYLNSKSGEIYIANLLRGRANFKKVEHRLAIIFGRKIN